MINISRRSALIGGGMSVLVAGGAGGLAMSGSAERLYAALVRHYLAEEPLAPDAASAFGREYHASGHEASAKVEPLVWMSSVAGFPAMAAALDGKAAFHSFTRRVATRFMLSSSMFSRSSSDEPIEFFGLSEACGNPWARFD
ncbi:hypothetical protein [Croceicoccus mobilis]|uniref:Uncharacterized protein n=1 Tax=Croceicoccus mobilis TaxID=1703339 RepID=A0A916YSE6_9SPHN|nr:hypothetical protein [Croceicoccus mobilis]GGD59321.1 hypothetical protein GCM10010990_05860 [Croceicoccus mobilis]